MPDPGRRYIPRVWGSCSHLGDQLPNAPLDRTALLTLAADESVSTEVVCWSIMAWGEMHGRHRNTLAALAQAPWIDVADLIRLGQLDRAKAYDAFRQLKLGKPDKMPGVGPAYFTKLIFFLMPRSARAHPVGYIMDQWAACSINLLTADSVVLTDCLLSWQYKCSTLSRRGTFTVSACNTSHNYENYCRAIEALAQEIGRNASETELALMSGGGTSKKRWREYVIDHRQPQSE
ncbi:8-oxoguanine DNA glycosylase OGG fold protein [Sphingomonas sp. AAP5]|uniref:8-oxoguanine DNA glycosylase OGG fold protein n=1 Tax=Sphingomonas sp. AAP5 TaxID=1523415 RepID=UPI0030065241